MPDFWTYAAALLPSIGICYLFYVVIKSLLEGDRNERLAMARLEKERERAAAQHAGGDNPLD